ncbi:MAG: CHAP domain-containing protein [Granulosicoccus sp.]
MASYPVLRFGSKGPDVARLVELLTSQGCIPYPRVTSKSPVFGRAVENMVLYFQMTHQGHDGEWMIVDGIVGPKTWRVLEDTDGHPQRSFLEMGIPDGVSETRRKILEIAAKEHGVCEDAGIPNRGKELDKYLPSEIRSDPSKKGPAWCAYFASWVTREAYGKHVLGKPVASVWTAYQRARQNDRWIQKGTASPIPGDLFINLKDEHYKTKWTTGHIGFVLQVSKDGQSINTIEGNCGNRVKIGKRYLADPLTRGFINLVGDTPSFTRGSLRGTRNLGASATR